MKICKVLMGLFVTLVLGACGGGGGGNSATLPLNNSSTINGITVPPAPANPTASLAGTDVNANGIRDDAERTLATTVGTNAVAHTAATDAAKQFQTAITATGAPQRAALQAVMDSSCNVGDAGIGLKEAESAVLNSRARQKALIDAYAKQIEADTANGVSSTLMIKNCN